MHRTRPSRLVTAAASAALLASMSVAVVAIPAAALDCTYTFPDEGGKYPAETVVAGEVICGGPGDDYLPRMDGGRFFGRGGNDLVGTLAGGRFYGNGGADTVETQTGGTFVGGLGKDGVGELGGRSSKTLTAAVVEDPLVEAAGTFRGGPGDDRAEVVGAGSTFYGGAGSDRVEYLYGLFRGGPDPDDVFHMNQGSRFFGARGPDAVDRGGGTYDEGAMFGDAHFNGGRGNDFADICGTDAALVSVESTSDDCPGDV